MKKVWIVGIFFTVISFSLSAQGFYFDIGLSVGKAWTQIDDNDMLDVFKSAGLDMTEVGADIGLKL